MEIINGYQLTESWNTTDAQGGEFSFAVKDGVDYFIKKLREPIYPKEDSSPKYKEAKKKQCDDFYRNKRDLISALQKIASGGGNIVAPSDIFLYKYRYYIITRKVNVDAMRPEEVFHLPEEEKIIFIRTLMMSMRRVHSVKVIHGDLKPDNVLISRTSKHLACKVIDFDDSYFEQKPPLAEDTVGTEMYYSPELAIYKANPDKPDLAEIITCKSDIFALGLILHQYLSGGKLPDFGGYMNAYQAVAHNVVLKADSSISEGLRNIINDMLLLDPDDRPSSEDIFYRLSKPVPEPVPVLEPEPIQVPVPEPDKWPQVQVSERNPNRVKITFEDGRTRVLDKWLAEGMGWKI